MGWASASNIAEPMIRAIKQEKALDAKAKLRLYEILLSSLQDGDWDCEYEMAGLCPVFDELLRREGLIGEEGESAE